MLGSDMTVSICIPSSAIRCENSKNLLQATYIAYQISKLATVYKVLELIVLDAPDRSSSKIQETDSVGNHGSKKRVFAEFSAEDTKTVPDFESDKSNEAVLLGSLLQYFITPPYLVKSLFKQRERASFKHAAKLPKLTALPFMIENDKKYKEGLTIPKHTPKMSRKGRHSKPHKKLQVTRFVNIGASKPLILEGQDVPVNVRVTVDLSQKKVVSPQVAYKSSNKTASFAYTVRYSSSISSIYTELGVQGGYTETAFVEADHYHPKDKYQSLPQYYKKDSGNILLLVGNWRDFEACAADDKNLGSISDVVDCKIAMPPGVRIEDAALIALAKLSNP